MGLILIIELGPSDFHGSSRALLAGPWSARSPAAASPAPANLLSGRRRREQEKKTLAAARADVSDFSRMRRRPPHWMLPVAEYEPHSLSPGSRPKAALVAGFRRGLRTDSPSSNRCSRRTFLCFSLEGSHFYNCYYYQDLHWRPFHARSRAHASPRPPRPPTRRAFASGTPVVDGWPRFSAIHFRGL